LIVAGFATRSFKRNASGVRAGRTFDLRGPLQAAEKVVLSYYMLKLAGFCLHNML
jgi:hypothetical protein